MVETPVLGSLILFVVVCLVFITGLKRESSNGLTVSQVSHLLLGLLLLLLMYGEPASNNADKGDGGGGFGDLGETGRAKVVGEDRIQRIEKAVEVLIVTSLAFFGISECVCREF